MSSSTGSNDAARSDDVARTAGRGGFAVLGAKVFFIVVGFIQQPLLRWAMGLASYGALSRVLNIANPVNNVMVSASTQGVSRAISRAPGNESQAFWASFRVHVPLALLVAVLFAAAAPSLANFQHAPHITLPLVALAGVVFSYGTYAPLIGALNGQRQFVRQAALDVTFAILRTIGLVGLAFLFVRLHKPGELGAAVGFVAAALLIVPIAWRWARPKDSMPQIPLFPAREYVVQLLFLGVAQFCLNVLMQVDLFMLGRYLSLGALTANVPEPTKQADEWVGVYRACQLFAFLPYQLLFSITQVLFPMLARARAEGDNAAVREYVKRGARIGAIAGGLLVSIIAALPGSLLGFAYGQDVAARGADTLRILALGQGAFAILGIALTILTSLGREWIAAVLTSVAASAIAFASSSFVSQVAFGGEQLFATAVVTGSVLVVTLLVGAFLVYRETDTFIPPKTALRAVLGVGVCVALGYFGPRVRPLLAPIAAIVVAVVYLAILVITRELRAEDKQVLAAVLKKRG